MSYWETYLTRLNQYGTDFKSRSLAQGQRNFAQYLKRSQHVVSFSLNGQEETCALLPNKMDEKQSSAFLLTRIDLELPSGTLLQIENGRWIIIQLQDIYIARGYNKYQLLKITHQLSWRHPQQTRSQNYFVSYGCVFGAMTNVIEDMFRVVKGSPYSPSDVKTTTVVMPFSADLLKEDYIVIDGESYTIAGYDKLTVPGILYVTLSSALKRDETPIPQDTNNFWLENKV